MLRVAAWLAVLSAAVAGYGACYDATSGGSAGQRVSVGLVTVRQPYDPVDVTSARGRQLVASYQSAVTRLAASGARVIVAPEKVFSVSSAAESHLVGSMRALARSSGVELVIGFVLDDSASGGSLSNVAMAFPASGGPPAAYRKQHLVPSYESAFVPGHSSVEVVDGAARIGLAICKDMDFPAVSRSYAQSGTGLLAVPAWDFTTDAWLHSRIALTAGVATGQPVARAARDGALTVSDAAGRVVAEARSGSGQVVSVQATVALGSHSTTYDEWGDWFAWLCVLLAAAGAVAAVRRQEVDTPIRVRDRPQATRVTAWRPGPS